MPFSLAMRLGVVPNLAAIPISVSPALTLYVLVADRRRLCRARHLRTPPGAGCRWRPRLGRATPDERRADLVGLGLAPALGCGVGEASPTMPRGRRRRP